MLFVGLLSGEDMYKGYGCDIFSRLSWIQGKQIIVRGPGINKSNKSNQIEE